MARRLSSQELQRAVEEAKRRAEARGFTPQQPAGSLVTQQPGSSTFGSGLQPTSQEKLRELGQSARVDSLQRTLDKSNNLATNYMQQEVPEEEAKPGVLNRIFDILSRPNYAMAEATQTGLEINEEKNREGRLTPGDLLEVLRGAKEGFTGREKTTFDDVLGTAGMEEGLGRGALGFGMDVLLDPTTYLGTGIVKAGGKGAMKAAAARSAKEVTEKAVKDTAYRQTLKQTARSQLIQENIIKARGGAQATKITPAALNKRVHKLVQEEARTAAQKTLDQFAKDNAGKVSLKVFGQDVASSEKMYDVLAKPFRKLGDYETGERFAKAFRPKAILGDAHESWRIHEGISVGMFEDSMDVFQDLTKSIGKADAKKISHAIENGEELADPKLNEIKEYIENMFDDFWAVEKDMGMHAGENAQKLDNYIYHVYEASNPKITSWKAARKKALDPKATFEQKRNYRTLEAAKAAGMKPVEDIRDIVALRAAKHFREISHRSFLMDVADNFGSQFSSKAAKHGVDKKFAKALKDELDIDLVKMDDKLPNIFKGKNVYLPKEVADGIVELGQAMDNPAVASKFIRQTDKILNATKFGLTAINPGHHIRNFVGDLWMNFLDGVVNPKVYKDAVNGLLADAGKGTARKIKIGSTTMDTQEIYNLYKTVGLKSGFFTTDLKRGVKSSTVRAIRSASDKREETARLAHFIDALKKEVPSDLGSKSFAHTQRELHEAALKAGRRVRKFNLDYGDLTPFEKNTMRRILTFYTFLRKNVPLQMQMLAMRPGRMAAAPKGFRAIENMLGTESQDPDYYMQNPKWVRELAAPRVGGTDKNPIYTTMQLPISDLGRLDPLLKMAQGKGTEGFGDIAREIGSLIRPEMRAVAELGTGQQMFSGAETPEISTYFPAQLPWIRTIQKMADENLTKRQKMQGLINQLTGAGIQEVTDQRRAGEVMRQQDIVQQIISEQRRKNRKEFFGGP